MLSAAPVSATVVSADPQVKVAAAVTHPSRPAPMDGMGGGGQPAMNPSMTGV